MFSDGKPLGDLYLAEGTLTFRADAQADNVVPFVKHDDGKPCFHLLATLSDALDEVHKVLECGAVKYSANNWARGTNWLRYWNAAMRHLWSWVRGENVDPETGLSHIAHAACCLLFILAYECRKIGEDDRPPAVS